MRFAALGVILLSLLNLANQWPSAVRQEQMAARAALAKTTGRQAVVIGGSTGVSIDFAAMELDGAPFFFSASDLFEAAAIGELIFDRPKPPCYLFLMIAPTATSVNNGSPGSAFAPRRRLAYQILWSAGRWRLIDGDWRQPLVELFAPSLGLTAWRPHIAAALSAVGVALAPDPDLAALSLTRLDRSKAPSLAVEQALDRAALIRKIGYYDPQVVDRATSALETLNAHVRARGGILIITSPPLTGSARDATNRYAHRQILELAAIESKLRQQGAIIADYGALQMTGQRLDLFYDNIHLNQWGASAFSRLLAGDLRAQGVFSGTRCLAVGSRNLPNAQSPHR